MRMVVKKREGMGRSWIFWKITNTKVIDGLPNYVIHNTWDSSIGMTANHKWFKDAYEGWNYNPPNSYLR